MTEHTELLALILPPQGRLVLAAADSAGLPPRPGLVLALEHKAATGSQTVAGLLDRERVGQLRDALALWLVSTEPPVDDGWDQPATTAQDVLPGLQTLETADENTVATWLASSAEAMDVDSERDDSSGTLQARAYYAERRRTDRSQ